MNAILGQLIAEPGHVKAQTGKAKILVYRRADGSGMDVIDTRGLNEGCKPVEEDEVGVESAIDSVVQVINNFQYMNFNNFERRYELVQLMLYYLYTKLRK